MLERRYFFALSGSTALALATVSATPPLRAKVGLTGPGETSLMRIQRGPNSWDRALDRLTKRGLGGAVVGRSPSG